MNSKSSGISQVKKLDREFRYGCCVACEPPLYGTSQRFNADIEAEIIDAWDDDDTLTYREVAKDLGIPRSTLHDYATKDMNFRMWVQLRN